MRLYVYCEGHTEKVFISEVLGPYLNNYGIISIPIMCKTGGGNGMPSNKGGVSKYSKIKRELTILCGSHKNELVTTMFDLYGLPKDTPGINKTVLEIESEISKDIGRTNLIANIMVHEFEALLFSDVNAFDPPYQRAIPKLMKIKDEFKNPERINNSRDTAPSKRIFTIIPEYRKVADGIIIAERIGIEKMREECPHFNKWVENLLVKSEDPRYLG